MGQIFHIKKDIQSKFDLLLHSEAKILYLRHIYLQVLSSWLLIKILSYHLHYSSTFQPAKWILICLFFIFVHAGIMTIMTKPCTKVDFEIVFRNSLKLFSNVCFKNCYMLSHSKYWFSDEQLNMWLDTMRHQHQRWV